MVKKQEFLEADKDENLFGHAVLNTRVSNFGAPSRQSHAGERVAFNWGRPTPTSGQQRAVEINFDSMLFATKSYYCSSYRVAQSPPPSTLLLETQVR